MRVDLAWFTEETSSPIVFDEVAVSDDLRLADDCGQFCQASGSFLGGFVRARPPPPAPPEDPQAHDPCDQPCLQATCAELKTLGTCSQLLDIGCNCQRCCTAASSPSPPPLLESAVPWALCTEQEMTGDLNNVNGFTLGDAIYVAQMWAGQQPQTTCMSGDFNGLNGFTLGDAIYVAQVWAQKASFLWQARSNTVTSI